MVFLSLVAVFCFLLEAYKIMVCVIIRGIFKSKKGALKVGSRWKIPQPLGLTWCLPDCHIARGLNSVIREVVCLCWL